MADEEEVGADEEKKKGGLVKILLLALIGILVIAVSIGGTLFLTGFFAAVFQPRFFQFGIHSLMPSMTYFESVYRTTLLSSFSIFKALIAAVNSIRLFVVSASPPCIIFSCLPLMSSTPQPPGPGFPLQAPSV